MSADSNPGAASASMAEWRQAFAGVCRRRHVNLVLYDSVVSTNDSARRVADEYLKESRSPPRCVLAAWEQRGGRGRQGREWVSPAGQGIYASWLEPFEEPSRKLSLPLITAVALAECIESLVERPCRIRWPNDLVVEGSKIGGILIESVERGETGGTAIIGFGINYAHAADAVPERKITAVGSLTEGDLALGVTGAELIEAMAKALDERISQSELVSRYRSLSVHQEGDSIIVHAGETNLRGTFSGFDDLGRLRLRTAEGDERVIGSGEVSV